jgi:outer membrane immunogenic protein
MSSITPAVSRRIPETAPVSSAAGKSGFGGKGNGLQSKINWLSTFRARGGALVTPNILLYATGGLAVGGVKDTFAPNGLGVSPSVGGVVKSASKTKAGWAAGGGLDYLLTPNVIVGVEALYVDLGTTTGTVNPALSAGGASAAKSSTFKNSVTIVRARLNYKF